MVTALAHVCFVVRDLDRSVAFYSDALGLAPAFDFINDEGARFGVYLHIGGRSFLEMFVGEPNPRVEGQSYAHICLEVEDVAATVADLRARGIEVTDAVLGSDQSWQAWLKDPDGNPLELHGYTAESWQAPHLR
ncbi:MAG TPA: VOC family protein [Armatimonadota bacterium]|jgi:catechol 2,3-dioxygenase-like lactoylglutathione lyase family enzyme